MTAESPSVYAYWYARHKHNHEDCEDKMLPAAHWDAPQAGLWKIQTNPSYKDGVKQGKKYVPMQIVWIDATGTVRHVWCEGLTLSGYIDGEPATEMQIRSRWLGAQHLTKADKDYYFKNDKRWKDDPPPAPAIEVTTAAPVADDDPYAATTVVPTDGPLLVTAPGLGKTAMVAPPPAGHNSGDPADFETLRAQVFADMDELAREMKLHPISDEHGASKFDEWRKRIAKNASVFDEHRREQMKPHEDEAAKIHAKWKPVIDKIKLFCNGIKDTVDAWGRAEQKRRHEEAMAAARKQHEEEQKRLRERAEAERAERERIEAERAQMMEDDPIAACTGSLPELPPEPEPVEPVTFAPVIDVPKVVIGTGAHGNRRSVKTEGTAKGTIMDVKAVAAFYAEQRHPKLIECLQKLVDQAAKSRANVPGVQMSWQHPEQV